MGVESDFALEIVFEPLELLCAERAEAVFLEVDDIVERHEMHAALVERIPAAAGRALAEAREIGVARLGIEDVMLAGRVMNVELRPADELKSVVELLRLGGVADVPGMDDERGLARASQGSCRPPR